MRTLPVSLQQELRQMFGPRVNFDEMERKIYSHDVGVMPRLIRPIIGNPVSAAVVQPKSEDELIALVRWANQHKVPLVPRAKATSGYGGVLPVKGGVTVDLHRLRKILEIDAQAMTVRVRPSVVWGDLEKELNKQGLALRTYPSSAPSSTVGGWLAQGGVGYGAYEYGAFRQNVVAARVVLPNGEVRVFEGDDLSLISDAEGGTGFITEVTLRVRKAEPEQVWGVRFESAADLAAALKELWEAGVPLWSVSFINPMMAHLKNRLPPKLEHGHPVHEHRPTMPEAYVAILVGPAPRWQDAEARIGHIVEAHGGALLDRETAEHEWAERFNLMHVKRLGPSLLPSEVVVPLDNLGQALGEIEKSVHLPLVMEGLVNGNGEVTLLGFIPHDERTFGYNVAFGLALTVIKIAKKYGGRPYSTGYYFAGEAETVLGADRVRKLREFKKAVDPNGIMNPGKVLGNGVMGTFMGLAQTLEPVIRVMGNRFRRTPEERIAGQGKRGIPDDVAWYAYACAQCGYCVDECDQYYGRGWESESPRGKWYFLREYMEGRAQMTQDWVDNFLACTTCEVCNVKCPLELPIEPAWLQMRGELIHKEDRLTFPPFEIMRQSLRKERNIWASYSKDRSAWVPEELEDKIRWRADIGYFPGCTASYVETDVAQGTARLLLAAGVEFTYMGDGEACCGLPMLVSGQWDAWEEIMRHNIAGMKARGVKTVVTSCPACWLSWKQYYPEWAKKLGIEYDFEVRHYSELLAQRIASGEMKFTHEVPLKVTWHDSCHMGRAGGIYEPPREVLKAIPGVEFVEMEHNRDNAHCCGGVLSLLEDPDAAKIIGDMRLQEAVNTGAQALVASCPCCEVQFRVTAQKTGEQMPIVDLAHLASEALGIQIQDPTDYAMELWGTFEAMIRLLKPEAMADFMVGLLPQMIDAMPGPFPAVMKWLKRTSPGVRDAMLAVMRPIMPKMFPILMPGMMPKVMPDMLAAVEKVVPMPPHMKEQMPDLMPAAMDNLMPKMLPLIIPHFMPKMEAYLKGELPASR